MKTTKHSEFVLTIEDFWAPQRCEAFISKSESIGYEPAKVQTEKGERVVVEVRNNQRVLFTDHGLADELWTQLKPNVHEKLGNSFAVGLNEVFRFYKYEPGQEFRKHRDQSFIRNEVEASYFTFMIYLNDGFKGGTTEFNGFSIHPKTGTALVFFHDLEHSGCPLIEGKKYVLRTDVMYRLKGRGTTCNKVQCKNFKTNYLDSAPFCMGISTKFESDQSFTNGRNTHHQTIFQRLRNNRSEFDRWPDLSGRNK